MALRTYRLRVPGAAEEVEQYREQFRTLLKQLRSPFFTTRADEGDLVVTAVFDGPPGADLLHEAQQVLPPDLRDRIALEEMSNPPYEITAQILRDKRAGTSALPGAAQAPEDIEAWEDFLARVRPRGLLELGSASGVFSRWLNKRVKWFKTIDIRPPEKRTPGFLLLDVWERPEEVRALIAEAPRPFVLYCDDGDKPREVATFAEDLRVSDFLAVHDFGTEIFERDIPSNFTERLRLGLTGFYEKTHME
jgi:hypothetical protein